LFEDMRVRHPVANGRKRWTIVAVFVGIVALQLVVAALSIDVLSAVRAYVNGESLYSKGQKDAHTHLLGYLQHRREEDFRAFARALAVPLGDRVAREALQRPVPDRDAARQGLLAGGNHPDDVAGMVRLFEHFHQVPFMARAIATWTAGDALVERMRELAQRAHAQIQAGADGEAVAPLKHEADELNERLSVLAMHFSQQLGEASRRTQSLLIGLNTGLAVLLAITGLAFVRRSAHVQARTEHALQRREQSLQRLLDSAAEGLYGVDVTGRCSFINRAALQMLGYAHEADLLGRDIHALIHHSHADGSEHPVGESEIFAAFRHNKRVHLPDAVFWRRDGSSFPVECWSHPVVEAGAVQGAVVTFVDISQRVKMQAALRAGEKRVMQLVDVVSEGVVTIDADERVVFFNRAAETIFGVPSADAKRSRIQRFIAAPRSLPSRFDAVPSGVIELSGLAADGRHFPIEASLSRLDTETGPLLTIVLRDVTEQHAMREERRSREALEAANRAKTEFLSRMSHELRTPLNAVLGFSHLLRVDSQQPPTLDQLGRIQHIENAGAHLLALVNDVLDLSRVESGQMLVSHESVSLKRVVLESFGMVAALAAERSIELLVDTGDDAVGPPPDKATALSNDGPWVVGDPVRWRQVIVNLLSNAVKYNHQGGQVTLSYRVDATLCTMRVADTGVGIAADQLERLFEPFNRLGAEKSGVEGTGIGLVLSRRLAELMGGTLRIDSEVDHGTTATLTLQRALLAPPAPHADAVPSAHAAMDGPIDVLYAEDDPVNAELVRQVLRLRPGVTLRIADCGARALALARERPPDLMLVDMNLGDMTGLQLARLLRGDPATRGVRLAALSADALPQQIAETMANGFERYLTKPVDVFELLRLVDRCCGCGAVAHA
jgi:PAS domain S-box-containing protein